MARREGSGTVGRVQPRIRRLYRDSGSQRRGLPDFFSNPRMAHVNAHTMQCPAREADDRLTKTFLPDLARPRVDICSPCAPSASDVTSQWSRQRIGGFTIYKETNI